MGIKIKESQKFEAKEINEFCLKNIGNYDCYRDRGYPNRYGVKYYLARDKKNNIVGICGSCKQTETQFEIVEFAVVADTDESVCSQLLYAVLNKIPHNSKITCYRPANQIDQFVTVLNESGFEDSGKHVKKHGQEQTLFVKG